MPHMKQTDRLQKPAYSKKKNRFLVLVAIVRTNIPKAIFTVLIGTGSLYKTAIKNGKASETKIKRTLHSQFVIL